MLQTPDVNTSSLTDRLTVHSYQQFTGVLNVQISLRPKWSIYFYRGRLVWATGGSHPWRRWRQNMLRYCSGIDLKSFSISNTDNIDCLQYQILSILVKRQQITREQIEAVVKNVVTEVLFDILQVEKTGCLSVNQSIEGHLSYSCDIGETRNILNWPLVWLNTESTRDDVESNWQNWIEAGFQSVSPNWGLVLSDNDKLKEEMSVKLYQKLAKIGNGKNSLRDLASALKQDLVKLWRSLLPYIEKGLMKLVDLPDLPVLNFQNSTVETKNSLSQRRRLIACVDDSEMICRTMERIVSGAGFRFIGITDSIQAVVNLMETKPDLIFLDLVMPVANGYEICAQIRRSSAFKEIPIIILTGKDGMVDRVRAKLAGCSDYITKPIEEKEVLEIVNKYLNPPAAPSPEVAHGLPSVFSFS